MGLITGILATVYVVIVGGVIVPASGPAAVVTGTVYALGTSGIIGAAFASPLP